jgi:UDP-N-acetylmuramoyl-tripeptide--D-alanyl-D-alanine ligase
MRPPCILQGGLLFLYICNMDIKTLHERYLESRTISTDSRNISPGCIFFALKGENFNGNLFARDALEKGASAAVVDDEVAYSDKRLIHVDDVLKTLQQLASFHRIKAGITVLAITGSNGKTTTKELCNAVLSLKYKVHATQGNLNNHIGVPLTLLSMKADCEFAIIEMGANHHGEIGLLCRIARPDYGLVTNIGKAHLEGFGGIEGVARAKGELFRYLIDNSKIIFLNGANKWLTGQIPGNYQKVIRYNANDGLTAVDISSDPYLSLTLKNGVNSRISTNLAGSYNAENILAACAVGLHFGIPVEAVANAISAYQPRNNRSQIIKTEKNTVFMDAYNANPSSMAAAVDEFLKTAKSPKMLILGEMREVGDGSDAEHAEIVYLLKKNRIENVIFVGQSFKQSSTEAGYSYAPTVDELNGMLANNPPVGYFIMVKGSRSNRLETILPHL